MLAPKWSPGLLALFGLGIVSAIVGLIPWLITGMRLPLQNLWGTDALPAQMPIALLPFSQYYVSFIVALILVGSTIAGIVGRATTARNTRAALVALMGGVLIIQIVATTQTAMTVSGGLSDRSASTLYLVALTGGTIAAILLGLGMFTLIARAPKPGALIALSIAAIASSSWMRGLAFPVGTVSSSSTFTEVMRTVIELAPAIAIGAAIVWCGVNSVGRMTAVISSLILLWMGPVFITAVSSAAGTRVLAPYPSEMLEYGVQVFRSALLMPELWASTLAIAVGIAAVGLVGLRSASKMSARSDQASGTR
ncbi:hypothetical protein [Salinibacterium sp.]|uniref:hypothetical protein n=1 Tax=Salinibacterium sp. TaxID=1915057 RepID=UPI00286A0019|nr:hypothetical protein [Salinibacterium sp.]